MMFSKVFLMLFLFVPMLASAKVLVPKDAKFRRLVRECPGLMKELKEVAKDFNILARREKISTVTLQGNFNQIVVDISIILEEGSRKKCENSFKSVWHYRDTLLDRYRD